MHINLILGLLVILAVIWLVKNHRRNKSARAEPAKMLMDEIEKRRAKQSEGKKAADTLAKLSTEKLREVVAGVNSMCEALPNGGAGVFFLQDEGPRVFLRLRYPARRPMPYEAEREVEMVEEELDLEWNVKNFDVELFSNPGSLKSIAGEYMIRMQDGTIITEQDLDMFMRRLSGLLADRLA